MGIGWGYNIWLEVDLSELGKFLNKNGRKITSSLWLYHGDFSGLPRSHQEDRYIPEWERSQQKWPVWVAVGASRWMICRDGINHLSNVPDPQLVDDMAFFNWDDYMACMAYMVQYFPVHDCQYLLLCYATYWHHNPWTGKSVLNQYFQGRHGC